MKFYKFSEQDKLDIAFNRCFIEAKQGRINLSLQRLKELSQEFPNDPQLIYAEALLRKDFLGQGLKAYGLFKRAYELDNQYSFAICNATKFSPNKEEFKSLAKEATKIAPNDKSLQTMINLYESYINKPYYNFLRHFMPPVEANEFGLRAAIFELILNNCPENVNPEIKVQNHRGRAESLRALDFNAESYLNSKGMQFYGEDRLALKEALNELYKIVNDEKNPASYDEELLNFCSAWTYLTRDFKQAIIYADRAIDISSNENPLPYLNKALSLWELSQNDEALIYAQEALQIAESANNDAHINQIKEAMDNHINKLNVTLEDLIPHLEKVLYGAGQIAEDEIRDQNGSIDEIANSFLMRVQIIGYEWDMNYVSAIAELLSFYSAEATFFIIAKVAENNPKLIDNVLNALLYLIGNSDGIMQHDAAYLLALNIIGSLNANSIKKTYRGGVLTTSAAAMDRLSQLDDIMRNELKYIHPSLPSLIAEQEPINAAEIEFANNNILSKFNKDQPVKPMDNKKSDSISNIDDQIEALIKIYSKKQLWSKVAKKICKKPLFGRLSKNFSSKKWNKTFKNWIEELEDVQRNRSPLPMIRITGELFKNFISRLIFRLYLNDLLSLDEKNILINTFNLEGIILRPKNDNAQILLIKALFEFSRMRREHIDASIIRIHSDIRTIDELLSYPLEMPLPSDSNEYDPNWEIPIPKGFENNNELIYSLIQERWNWINPDVPEFHFFMSYNSSDYDYMNAIQEISLQYPSLHLAYEEINKKNDKTPNEKIFTENYLKYWNYINEKLPKMIFDPFKGRVEAPWHKNRG